MEMQKFRILVIGAHPDDCEGKTAGTSIKFREYGHVVKYIYTTNGDAGHHELKGARLAEIRAEEVKNGCSLAGIEYQIMENHDAFLEASINNREKVITAIRQFMPDIVITHRPNDYHPDHRNTSTLVMDSSYLLTVPNVCPSVPVLRRVPVILYMSDGFKKPMELSADIVVDIDSVIYKKVKILDCHKSQYYEWLPWNRGELQLVPEGDEERMIWLADRVQTADASVADRYRHKLIISYGSDWGKRVKYAEAFEISEYGRHVSHEELMSIFQFKITNLEV